MSSAEKAQEAYQTLVENSHPDSPFRKMVEEWKKRMQDFENGNKEQLKKRIDELRVIFQEQLDQTERELQYEKAARQPATRRWVALDQTLRLLEDQPPPDKPHR